MAKIGLLKIIRREERGVASMSGDYSGSRRPYSNAASDWNNDWPFVCLIRVLHPHQPLMQCLEASRARIVTNDLLEARYLNGRCTLLTAKLPDLQLLLRRIDPNPKEIYDLPD